MSVASAEVGTSTSRSPQPTNAWPAVLGLVFLTVDSQPQPTFDEALLIIRRGCLKAVEVLAHDERLQDSDYTKKRFRKE